MSNTISLYFMTLYFQEFHQHDAQELNRILFSAIEDSLIGTPGQTLIRELYHGTIVNQVAWLYSILLIIAYFLLRFSAGLSRFFMFFWSTCEKKKRVSKHTHGWSWIIVIGLCVGEKVWCIDFFQNPDRL